MNRRRYLTAASTLLAGAALGCRSGSGGTLSPPPPRVGPARPTLPVVHASPDRVIRTVVGLRPFRRSGYRVEVERLDETTVVHNYGHGGGGITLSWGTSELALDLARGTEVRTAAVLGCGAVGLATARLLQLRGFDVRIYAKELPPNTTSDVAGGQFAPFSVVDPGQSPAGFGSRHVDATERSWRHFQRYLGPEYGVRFVDNWAVGSDPGFPPEVEAVRHLFTDVRLFEPGQHPFPDGRAMRFNTMLVETPRYLRELHRDVLHFGATVEVREIRSASEIVALPENLVFNCTGLGARAIFDDMDLIPIKGQLTVLRPQSEIDYVKIGTGTYMMPRSDGILLGGTFERDVWTLEPDPEAATRIMTGHQEFFRRMAEANASI